MHVYVEYVCVHVHVFCVCLVCVHLCMFYHSMFLPLMWVSLADSRKAMALSREMSGDSRSSSDKANLQQAHTVLGGEQQPKPLIPVGRQLQKSYMVVMKPKEIDGRHF